MQKDDISGIKYISMMYDSASGSAIKLLSLYKNSSGTYIIYLYKGE